MELKMKLKEAIIWAFDELKVKELHINQITEKVRTLANYKDLDSEKVKAKVNALLARCVKRKDTFAHAKNQKTGRNASGKYRLVIKKTPPIITADNSKVQKLQPHTTNPFLPEIRSMLFPPPDLFDIIRENQSTSHQASTEPAHKKLPIPTNESKPEPSFFGKAGEYAVVSELLLRGYQASIIAVDKGIDISAIKNDKLFLIQVKTTWFKDDKITATVKTDSLKKNAANNVFFIIVFRYNNKNAFVNRYLIFNSRDLDRYTQMGLISTGNKNENIIIKVKQEGNHLYLYNDDKQQEVDWHLDNFEQLN
jgi:hypothetical protein